MKLARYFIICALLNLVSQETFAGLITWELKAAVTHPSLASYASTGDIITLKYSFDSSIPDALQNEENRSHYVSAITQVEISLNDQYAEGNGKLNLTIVDEWYGRDGYYTSASAVDPFEWEETFDGFDGYLFSGFGLKFRDDTAKMFDDILMPKEPFFPYGDFRLDLSFSKPVSHNVTYGRSISSTELLSFENVTPIPAPTSLSAFALGLGLLGYIRARQKRVRALCRFGCN